MLFLIQKLYKIEREIKGESDEIRLKIRQERSVLILNELHALLSKNLGKYPPKHGLEKAINYTLKRFSKLSEYTNSGHLLIDNNPVESCIRPVALGRKNYLFAGSDNGAKWAALVYSLVISARNKGRCELEYLSDILTRISEHPYKRLDELLP